jgi:phospho-N-acetylmuramoyl-pentapeptide-transferase
VVDDSYNANPDSMRAAIDVLASVPGKRIFVMGDMGEAGAAAGQFHDEIGGYAKSHGIDRLFCLGELSRTGGPQLRRRRAAFRAHRGPAQGLAGRARRADHGAGQGLALHEDGTRGRTPPLPLMEKGWGPAMLLELAQWLARDFRGFNVFGYITLRAVLATMTALAISFIFGPAVIRWLAAKKIGQSVRSDGPQTHLVKAGTPTMGGALILISLGFSTLLWADLSNRFVWVVLFVTLGFGAVGWVDDWRKVVYRNPERVVGRAKFFWQSVIGGRRRDLHRLLDLAPNNEKVIELPMGGQRLHAGAAERRPTSSCPSSKVCLSAGHLRLHGAHLSGDRRHQQRGEPDRRPRRPGHHADSAGRRGAGHLRLRRRPCGVLQVPAAALHSRRRRAHGVLRRAGRRRAGFLWFNAYPAEVFMGDVGALALGAALGAVAVIARQEIVLFIMGGVFVAETLSVMLQVGYFKYTKKKYGEGRASCCMAPLHHHFRADRLEGDPGRGALLDHHDPAGAVRPVHLKIDE